MTVTVNIVGGHTPGPWFSRAWSKSEWFIPEIWKRSGGEVSDCIAKEADARLAAAAPELLAACKSQHRIIDGLMAVLILRDPAFRPSKSDWWHEVVSANEAVAKAEGRS